MAVREKSGVAASRIMSRGPRTRESDTAGVGPVSANGLRVSEAAYWAEYYQGQDSTYEWNNGILEEKPMADYLSFAMYSWFFSLLKEYLTAHPIARMIGLEIGFRLTLPNAVTIRRPDLAVIAHSNPVAIADDDCTYRGVFDLCVEFLSDSKPQEVRRDTVVKKYEYCQAGVREYFILDRKGRETAFYRLTQAGVYTPMPRQPDDVIRSTVLPGFQFRLHDLYQCPDLHDRLDDHVYNAFVLLDYQTERQRAADAERRAELAAQRAEEERRRADAERRERQRLAALLENLGHEPT